MSEVYRDDWLTVLQGDCREVMAAMEPESVNCVVTSPPYFGLRDYGIAPTVWGGEDHEHEWGGSRNRMMTPHHLDESDASIRGGGHKKAEMMVKLGSFCPCGAWLGVLGLEPSPELYVAHMVEVFRAVRRVLRKDGTVWFNLGDSYSGSGQGGGGGSFQDGAVGRTASEATQRRAPRPGFKPKDRLMIPARVAIALQADGWWLRDEIVWSKPNPMPSSVTDRTTPAHEMVYLLTRSARYAYDAAAIAETSIWGKPTGPSLHPSADGLADGPATWQSLRRNNPDWQHQRALTNSRKHPSNRNAQSGGFTDWQPEQGRNKRSVWTVATAPYPDAHFATFPPKLVEPMILAGCPPGGVVLDCFAGSGTVGLVAQRLSRRAVLIDLNADYLIQAMRRNQDVPLGLEVPA